MKLGDNIYTSDERVCPVCGSTLETVYFYSGTKVDHQVYRNEDLFSGTKTTTAVTTYTNVHLQTARYCAICKKRVEYANRPGEKAVKERRKRDKIKNIVILLLSVIVPVALGFATSASSKMFSVGKSLDTLSSILLLLTIGASFLGIRGLGVSISNLRCGEDPVMSPVPYYSMEQRIVNLMNGQKKDRSVQYFTKEEYQKLQPRR